MKKITQEMIHIFKMTDFDWMGYELTKEANYFTFHHIIKKEHGGKEKINNGAILIGNSAHNYLHIIESRELDMYVYINKILKEINNQRYLPTKEQLLKIYDCLEKFERDHSGDVNRNGDPLIKERYTKRIILK